MILLQSSNNTLMLLKIGKHPMPSKYAKGFIPHVKGKVVPVLNK
jgi:hypothetical protein